MIGTTMTAETLYERMLEFTCRMSLLRALDPLVDYVIAAAVEVFEADYGCALLFGEGGEPQLSRVQSHMHGYDAPEMDMSLAQYVARTRAPYVSPDAQNMPSVLYAPLIVEGRMRGVIGVENRSASQRFTQAAVAPFMLFADHAAAALENARQTENLETRLEQRTAELKLARDEIELVTAERRQMQERIVQTQMEEERVKLLMTFITDVSHHFRTPLSIIGVNADLMARKVDDSLADKHLEPIHRQITLMTQLLTSLVAMARLDSLPKLALKPVNLNPTLIGVVKGLQPEINAKALTVDIDLVDGRMMVNADASELAQAFERILINAVQYTPHGGRIHVMASDDGAEVVITVRDSGVGIAPEALPRIFTRFYRADKAGTTRGFGLGLSIANRIIELHNGRIEVRSMIEQGSEFRVVLPHP
jgi:signal transduction histidine kinase